tara:strand:+ start:618 stop:983 length:366 start_codon:yes stop_codon:yes gene_type:complete
MKHADFKKNNFVIMENIFSEVELNYLQKLFLKEFSYEEILSNSSEFHLKDKISCFKIIMLSEQASIIQRINELTGFNVREVQTRIYYTNPDCNNLTWHNDSEYNDKRLGGLRVELSKEPYE